jgi:hypothetical protein
MSRIFNSINAAIRVRLRKVISSFNNRSLPDPEYICPACGKDSMVKIVYGLVRDPSKIEFKVNGKQRIALGGCVQRDDSAYCDNCGYVESRYHKEDVRKLR